MYRLLTVLGIAAALFLTACERQEQRPAERAVGTEQREGTQPAAPAQTPGQTQEQAPGQPGTTPGQAPAGGEQRQ